MGLTDTEYEEVMARLREMSDEQRRAAFQRLSLQTGNAHASPKPIEVPVDGTAPPQARKPLPPPIDKAKLAAALDALPAFTPEEVDRMEAAIQESKASWDR